MYYLIRIPANVPDPIFGPKEVRLLLLFRGFIGFFGLFGIYYSLQYLSLSDATVLTFLVPLCTAMAGALFLGEKFARREAFAGLVSLVGVVLIARPTAIFNSASQPDPHLPVAPPINIRTSPVEKGTQSQRLIAVMVALIGVLGATGAFTTIRAIGKRAHPMHSMMFFFVHGHRCLCYRNDCDENSGCCSYSNRLACAVVLDRDIWFCRTTTDDHGAPT